LIQGWNWAWLKKKYGKKKLGVTRLTRQDPVKNPVNCNPLTFVFLFLLKQRRFDLIKKN
jgi:hypothetical protein